MTDGPQFNRLSGSSWWLPCWIWALLIVVTVCFCGAAGWAVRETVRGTVNASIDEPIDAHADAAFSAGVLLTLQLVCTAALHSESPCVEGAGDAIRRVRQRIVGYSSVGVNTVGAIASTAGFAGSTSSDLLRSLCLSTLYGTAAGSLLPAVLSFFAIDQSGIPRWCAVLHLVPWVCVTGVAARAAAAAAKSPRAIELVAMAAASGFAVLLGAALYADWRNGRLSDWTKCPFDLQIREQQQSTIAVRTTGPDATGIDVAMLAAAAPTSIADDEL